MRLQPCHKMLADIYIRFGDGRKLKTHLMGPNDWERMGESLWQHTNWVNRIVKLEEMALAARIVGDKQWSAEIATQMARLYLNTTGGNG